MGGMNPPMNKRTYNDQNPLFLVVIFFEEKNNVL